MILPIKVGDTITINEADYGGVVALPISRLTADHLPDGSDWVQVSGVEPGGNGREIDARTALARTASLRRPS